ncbi:hypothetical protein OO012_04225 [Rhodobacteraceae bacterium KMM 6894]|nr:hypothetical protein [Rhodobacteraceae bacterium KMM 6894]
MHKIATCCYCGTRAALVMRRDGRHELSCSACGAPLHEIKAMPCAKTTSVSTSTKPVRRGYAPDPAPHRPRKRRKPRKSLIKRVFEEVWDVVEDVFD